jgi:hypothetical protein
MSSAEIAALSWKELSNVTGRDDPFHRTTDVGRKFDPESVSVNPALPTVAEDGEILDKVGTGLDVSVEIAFPAELAILSWAKATASITCKAKKISGKIARKDNRRLRCDEVGIEPPLSQFVGTFATNRWREEVAGV